MKTISRLVTTILLISAFLSNALTCGPGYIEPLFDTTSAPETPYRDFAGGRLGIVKSSFRRSVLYAAYRHIAGNGMNTAEQQAIIEVWKAEIDNKDFRDDSVDDVVKAWVEKRKEVMEKEEKPPDIYVERTYGGYDFFPNCTKNAFETATTTLLERVSAYGKTDQNVRNWINGQDQVFSNCASGKQTPDAAPLGSPMWLQKDRAYQGAAAAFYSLDYTNAKRQFAEIAQDTESPWQETADYLVARTLIRQASLSKSVQSAAPLYEEAEIHLQRFINRTGKFSESAQRLEGLIRYRLYPKERLSELAKKLSIYGNNENFRQDVIDYNWLLDKFEADVLHEEEKRKEAEKPKDGNVSDAQANSVNTVANAANSVADPSNRGVYIPHDPTTKSNIPVASLKKNEDDITNYVSNDDYSKNWLLYVERNATDEEALAAAEKLVGSPLTDGMKKRVREARQSGYASGFADRRQSDYQGGYYGEVKLTPSLLSDFLKQDDLTDWLYTYQMSGAEAYLSSLEKYKASGSELWLMTALSKADKSSTQLPRLIEAAEKATRTSPAYPTIAFHTARILIAQGRSADARKLIDEMLDLGDVLPISARNSFFALKLTLSETLEDFLKYSLKKPYAFDFDGDVGSVDDLIAEQKTYYDPEYNKDGREAYDAEVEARYKEEKIWQHRLMFDSDTIEVFNQHFPTASLLDVMRSPALPEYMKERFAIAIWTRAFLLNDNVTLSKITPEIAKHRPEFETLAEKITVAKTPAARDNAILYFVLKNPLLSPFIETGMGKTNNEQEQWSSDDWWCEPYDSEYSDETNSEQRKGLPKRPAFLTAAQSNTAQTERKRLKTIGDAPKFLAEKVLTWARRNPTDRRVPEALYIMIEANGWTKYGCGNNEELRDDLAQLLKARFPNSEWTKRLREDEAGEK